MEPEGSSPHSQQPTTCPYPEPDRASPCPHPISRTSILILSSHLCLYLPSVSFLKPYMSCTSPCVRVALLIQHARHMRRNLLSSAASLAPPYSSTLFQKRHNFQQKKKLLYFHFLYNFYSKHFAF